MENKKRRLKKGAKILLIIVTIILLFVILLVVIKLKNNNKDELVIASKQTYVDYKYEELFDKYLFVSKNGKLGAIDNSGNTVIDFFYPDSSNILLYSDVVIIKSVDNYYVYDNSLNLLLTLEGQVNFVSDLYNNETFYYYDNKLYNLKGELLYDSAYDYFSKVGNYIFTDYEITNIETEEKIDIRYIVNSGNNVYATSKDESLLYIYNLEENKFIEYQNIETYSSGYLLKYKDDEYIFTPNQGLIDKKSKIDVGEYKFDFSVCEHGFKIYDKKNNSISEVCYYDYYTSSNPNVITLLKDEASYFLNDGEIIENKYDGFVVGNYITNFSQEDGLINIYDLKGNKIENSECLVSLNYLYDNKYICSDGVKDFIVDDSLNKISESYDSLYCPNESYCVYAKDEKYGLLLDGKQVIEPRYNLIISSPNNDRVVAQSLFQIDVFSFAKSNKELSKEKINEEFEKPYITIDTNETIRDYNLEEIKDLIYKDEDLFKKYAYIVINNDKLGDYKSKVMKAFYEVVSNKEYLDEDYFLESLRKLSIEKKDTLDEENVVGLYYDFSKSIELLNDNDNVLYHELTHFIDYSFTSNSSNSIYKCGDEYLSYNEFRKLKIKEAYECELIFSDEVNFMVEGGAEYYSSHYLNDNVLRTYKLQTNVIGALSYIYGYDKINDIFFDGEDGYYNLFMLFENASISKEEYANFLEITSRFHSITIKDYFYVTDILIRLYEKNSSKTWYEDKEFGGIISLIIGFNEVDSSYTSRYSEYEKLDYDFYSKTKNILGEENMYNVSTIYEYMKTDDGTYLVFDSYGGNDFDAIIVKYDFENDTVLDMKKLNY